MSFRYACPRSFISLIVAVAVGAFFTLRAFAAPEITSPEGDSNYQGCTGVLSVKSGQVTINGNLAQTGATVMTGSVIATSSNGKAIIDLGALGRVEVGDNTLVTITCSTALLEVVSSCNRIEVEVRAGTVDVKLPTAETLTAGKKATYDGSVDFTSGGGVDVKVECEGHKRAGLIFGPSVFGLLAIIGLSVAVIVGVASEGEAAAVTSPTRP